jgi:hypothetical protein
MSVAIDFNCEDLKSLTSITMNFSHPEGLKSSIAFLSPTRFRFPRSHEKGDFA